MLISSTYRSVTSETSRVIDKITVFLCLSIAMAYALFLAGVDKTQYKVRVQSREKENTNALTGVVYKYDWCLVYLY